MSRQKSPSPPLPGVVVLYALIIVHAYIILVGPIYSAEFRVLKILHFYINQIVVVKSRLWKKIKFLIFIIMVGPKLDFYIDIIISSK